VAEILLTACAGDFVFRIGDDQFLVLLVDAAAHGVLSVAGSAAAHRVGGVRTGSRPRHR
jgi:GGDEF domain-containing protein